MKARIAHILRETPILFIGTVLVIAVTFRVGIGAVKTASAEPEERPTPVVHTPVTEKAVAPAVATPVVQAEPTSAAPAMPEPPKPLAKRKSGSVPRVHGRR